MRPNSPKRNPESGYALLLIFAMAAIVAIGLYSQVPRVVFEAQRDKEQLLMDRGQEYSRAIALFVRKFNRFPTSMDELENTNNMRFLRARYADPMTGKTDWRILHAGPGGVITDSILTAKKTDGTSSPNDFITTLGPMTGAQPAGDGEAGVNIATRKRASDQPGAAGDPTAGGGSGSPDNSVASNGSSNNSGSSGYSGPVMVLPDGRIVPANASGTAPATPAPGANPAVPGSPGIPGLPGSGAGVGGPLPTGVAVQNGYNGVQSTQNGLQNGQNTPMPPQLSGPPNSAANLINQILTSPRPGGLNGTQGGGVGQSSAPTTTGATTNAPAAPQQQVIGAGLAGVASKREQEGIKTYNDRTKYNEWEFVYDVTKDPTKMGQQQQGAAGASGGQNRPGAPGQSPTGATSATPATGTPPMTPGTPSQ